MAPVATCVADSAPAPRLYPQGEVVVHAEAGRDTAVAHLVVLNAGRLPARVLVAFQASAATGIHVVSVTPALLPARAATRMSILLAGLRHIESATTGELVVRDCLSVFASPVSITPGLHAAADWPTIILAGAFIAMAVLAAGVFVRTRKNREWATALAGRAPGPKWTFSSWATTFTAVGAVFGTVVGAVTIPGGKQVDEETLVRINLLFGALVVAAPFIFQSLRAAKVTTAQQDAGLWGFNWALLIACSVTAGAVLGELAALQLLAWEAIGGGPAAWIAIAVLLLLQILAARYFILTTWSLVTTKWEERVTVEATKAQAVIKTLMGLAHAIGEGEMSLAYTTAEREGPSAAETVQLAPRLQSWSLP